MSEEQARLNGNEEEPEDHEASAHKASEVHENARPPVNGALYGEADGAVCSIRVSERHRVSGAGVCTGRRILVETAKNRIYDIGIEFAKDVESAVLQHLIAPPPERSPNGVNVVRIKQSGNAVFRE